MKKKKSTFSFKKKSTLGIDVGSFSTKLVKLTHKEGAQSKLDFFGLVEAKPSDENYSSELKKFLSKHKLQGLSTAATLDDESMKIRKLELPKMPDSDLKEAVKWKMRDVVDGDIEEFIVRWSELPSTDNTKQLNLVGYAVKKAAVNQVKQLLSKAGAHIDHIEPSIVSLSAACELIYPSDDYWVGCLDIGQTSSIMSIMGNGKFYFSRPLPGVYVNNQNLAGEEFLQRIAAEIQNTLDTFSVIFKVETLQKVLLSGSGAKLGEIENYLTTNLGVECEVIKPFINLVIDDNMIEQVRENGHLFTQAQALARIVI